MQNTTQATHTKLGIQVIPQKIMNNYLAYFAPQGKFISYTDVEGFIALNHSETGIKIDYFETFACCIAFLDGGMSASFLNAYDAQNENDTDDNLYKYRSLQYGITVTKESKLDVVTFTFTDSYEFIRQHIGNAFDLVRNHTMKKVDVYCDDEFLINNNVALELPSFIFRGYTLEEAPKAITAQDTMIYGNLVFVSSDEEGDTVGLDDKEILEILETLRVFNLQNPKTGETRVILHSFYKG